jgi:hypothetical protein
MVSADGENVRVLLGATITVWVAGFWFGVHVMPASDASTGGEPESVDVALSMVLASTEPLSAGGAEVSSAIALSVSGAVLSEDEPVSVDEPVSAVAAPLSTPLDESVPAPES